MIELSDAASEKSLERDDESGVSYDENGHHDEVHSLISIDEKEKERSVAENDDMEEDQTKRSAYYMDLDIPEKHLDRYPSNALEEVNPFIILTNDDEDDASIGMESVFGAKMLPQFDIHGDFFDDYDLASQPIKNLLITALETFKYLYSIVLLVFCVVLVMSGIFTKQSSAAEYNIHPIGAFFLFWFLILWLAVIEGGQGCLVGLQAIDKRKYEESHPNSLKNTLIAHKGDNMERFIVGRQFLTVLVIFLINLCGSAIKDANPLGLSKGINDVFLGNGIAMMITTIVIGQLTSQVNAALCMLDFINNYFMLLTTYVSLAIEFSGLLHCAYLVQYAFALITKKPVESKEPNRGIVSNLFFWGRVLMSAAILCFALAVTIKALLTEQSGMYDGVPISVSIIIFFLLVCIAGLMEGMQIAAFALINMSEEELEKHSVAASNVAASNCKLMFSGQNLESFLIGRQIFVASLIFIVAKIATINIEDGEDNIFGVSDRFQSFLDTGLLGAVVLTIIGSLAWRIIAASFPLAFMSNPILNIIIRICLLLEASGICSSCWVLVRFQKRIFGYEPDDVYLEGAEKNGGEPITQHDRDVDRFLTVMRYIYSLSLLVFCVVLVMAGIFTKQSTAAEYNIHPIGAFFLFWFLILWLAVIEGGQGCLIGLKSIDHNKYSESHPKSLKSTRLVQDGDNMERFIVGRQFLVVLVMFLINLCGSAIKDADPLGLPKGINDVFLGNGIAMMITAIVIGQLTSQVNAALCMLDFINNYFMLLTTYVSLAIEFSGLLHSVYLVQYALSLITKKPVESKEPKRGIAKNFFFWGRVLMSTAILCFALAVTIKALLTEQSGMYDGVPVPVSICIFFVLMFVVGLMEGMQIAAFALLNMPKEELEANKVAASNCKLMFQDQNLQAFLIGRQIFVASLIFIVAKIATINIEDGEDNIFGVSDRFQSFLDIGLLGAVVLTIIGSLAWRIIAASFPLAFMSNPTVFVIIQICLLLENTGICSSAWVLARTNKKLAGLQPDDVYLEEAPRHDSAPVTKRDKDIEITNSVIKYICSMTALVFCIAIVMSGFFSNQTVLSKNVHPSFAFLLFWFLILWLAVMEGGQGSLVGLQRVDSSKYEYSHPKAHKIASVAHTGKNMERFILGRQFLVVLFIFFINLCGRPVGDASIFGFSDTTLIAVTLENSLAMMFVTIIIGQLASQMNAATCMLDFIDNYFMLMTTYISLAVEFSGLLHAVYLVQYVFEKVAGTPTESILTLDSKLSRAFFWLRVALSSVILLFSLAVTIEALAAGKGGILQEAGPVASIIIFFALLCFTGILEGIQIAAFALLKMPEEEVLQHGVAAKNSKMIFSKSSNIQAFMVGRQVLVTSSMFIIANIVEIEIQIGEENIFGVNSTFQGFVNAGFLGAIILTIIGSLAWRIVAGSYPLAFMSNPIVYLIIRVCLLIAGTGICSSAILLAFIQKSIVNYLPDEEYIGNFDMMDKSQYADGSSYGYSLLRHKQGGLDEDGNEEEQQIPDGLDIMFQSKHNKEEETDGTRQSKDQSLRLLLRETRNDNQSRVGESGTNTITSSFMFPIGLNDSIQRLP